MWYNNILEITNKTVKAIWNCKLNYLLIPLPTVCCDLITSCQLQDDATFGNDATFGMTSVFTLKFNVRFKMITIQSVLGNLKWGECLLKVCQRYYMKWEECLLVSLYFFFLLSYVRKQAPPQSPLGTRAWRLWELQLVNVSIPRDGALDRGAVWW
jgi:hypothetical protein